MSGRGDRYRRPTAVPGGLTLTEVLVVIAIVGLLVGLLIPGVSMTREVARQATCLNNLKQFGAAVQNYEAAFGGFPPAATGMNGITFFPLITNYIDDGAANAFGLRLNLEAPGERIPHASVDGWTMTTAVANAAVLAEMPQFPFFTCPTRGFRVSRSTQNANLRSINCDYAIVVSDTFVPGRMTLRDALCPGAGFCPAGCNPKQTPHPGRGILNFARGREKVSQEQYDALPLNWSNPSWALGGGWCYYYVWPGFYTNMIDLVSNGDGGFNVAPAGGPPPPARRFQRPYENWTPRTRADSVPDGLSMTALLAEKHLSARELGVYHGFFERRPRGANPTAPWGNDSVALAGQGGYTLVAHATRAIAFGPNDESNPHHPAAGEPCSGPAWSGNCVSRGPTIGSWHPGNAVNMLMADGAVRAIGSDIDTLNMLPMLGTRNDVDVRTDGRLLTLP